MKELRSEKNNLLVGMDESEGSDRAPSVDNLNIKDLEEIMPKNVKIK
jgi:hypothetical protein